MAGALQNVAWEQALVEPRPDKALEAYARQRFGMPYPVIRYFTSVPWFARAMIDLHPEYGLLMHLEQRVADLLTLIVSQENSCRFCYAATRTLLRIQGMSEARIQRMEQDLTRADLPPQAVAAVAFGRSQSRSGPPAAREAREALSRAGVGADEMKEIAYAVAIADFSNRASTILALPPYQLEAMPDRLHVRLLRPLINRLLEKGRSRGKATPLERAPSYPYAHIVKAYAGSPIAPVLGRTLEEMWASTLLARRCKLLMLAVVARGLACEVCAREVGNAIREEGLKEATLTQVLTHLDAPELDPIERALVPFARETIWYQPAAIQRRARELRDRLSGPQFVEAVGVVSLANGLCRLGASVVHA